MSLCSLILSLGSSCEYSSSCQRLWSDCAGWSEPLWSHISHCWKSHVTAGSAVAQWKSAWLETKGPRVRASPESLPWLEQDTFNPSLVLVQPKKIGPFITERLLMGRKESNQTNKNHVIAHFMYLLGQDTTTCLDLLYLSLFFKLTYIYRISIFSCCRADAFIKYIFLQLNWLFI